MRFLSMIRVEENTGQVPSERLMTEMGQLIDEMTKSGVLLDTAGLRPTSEGARVRLRNGKLSTVDGPFTEAKEVIGGFALLEAASLEEALEHTRRFLAIHGDEWNLECEVRPLEEPGDMQNCAAQAKDAHNYA
ncbi:YciI family protein [Lysobacter niastensis]|uniref:Transcriptional regulator n=1 Tax=Lysobacter niastensis TaxID=380629 RepID=A0ABS0BC57_9GAMM|nr:YciI family protein [Lysobacter niastensis]MBF6024569.1 transcriptional regulator [Lysobacter niastensis]